MKLRYLWLASIPLASIAMSAQAQNRASGLLDPAPVRESLSILSPLATWAQSPAGQKTLGDNPLGTALRALTKSNVPDKHLAPFSPLIQGLSRIGQQQIFSDRFNKIASMSSKEQKELIDEIQSIAFNQIQQSAEDSLKKTDREKLHSIQQDIDRLTVSGIYGNTRTLGSLRDRVSQQYRNLTNTLVFTSVAREAAKLSQSDPNDGTLAYVRAFITAFHKDLPSEIVEQKLEKSVANKDSDAETARAWPQLDFLRLSENSPLAELINKSPKIPLQVDFHAKNLELQAYKDFQVPDGNDYDDAGTTFVGLEQERMLLNAAELRLFPGNHIELIQAAAGGYRKALSMDYAGWVKSIQDEHSIKQAAPEDRNWHKKAGKPVPEELADALLKLVNLDPDEWTAFNRMGAGLSSIGLRRYMFVHHKGHAYELKELRDPAYVYFDKSMPPLTNRQRVAEAYKRVAHFPIKEVSTLAYDGADWLLRRRERYQTSFNFDHPVSIARVLGGLAAQSHKRFAHPKDLIDTLDLFTEKIITDSFNFMHNIHLAVSQLLKDGSWHQ